MRTDLFVVILFLMSSAENYRLTAWKEKEDIRVTLEYNVSYLLGYNIVAIITLIQDHCVDPIGLHPSYLTTYGVHLLIVEQLPGAESSAVNNHIES